VWTQQASFKASNTQALDTFGVSIALSADGNRLAIGAPGEDGGDTGVNGDQGDESVAEAGAVYVYTREIESGTADWFQEAYVKASNAGEGDAFGSSLALSGNGALLVVGAPTEGSNARGLNGDQFNENAPFSGAAYMFARDEEDGWEQINYIKASNTGGSDRFGIALALSADGGTLVVTALNESSSSRGVNQPGNDLARNAGAAYVFVRDSDGVFAQEAFLKASNTALIDADQFGSSIAISADGSTIAVGTTREDGAFVGLTAEQDDNDAPESGAAYVFVKSSGEWSQRAFVKASNTATFDRFGKALALSGDGQTLAVSAFAEASNATGINGDQGNDSASGAGAVYLY
jgi:hypothetical protein